MVTIDIVELERLGLDAARSIAGDDAVEEVEVVKDYDLHLDRPIYRFAVLIDPDRSQMRVGLVLSRLAQRLAGELAARDDDHEPVIQLLNRTDWPRRRRA